MTGRTSGRTTSARRWLAIAMSLNPRCPPPWRRTGELAAQLQYALDYRVIIERGVGYLMARDGLDSMTAFNRLRRAARDTQAKSAT